MNTELKYYQLLGEIFALYNIIEKRYLYKKNLKRETAVERNFASIQQNPFRFISVVNTKVSVAVSFFSKKPESFISAVINELAAKTHELNELMSSITVVPRSNPHFTVSFIARTHKNNVERENFLKNVEKSS